MPVEARAAIRVIVVSILAGAVGIALLVAVPRVERADAGAGDSAAVRGYIVPTANNPDVEPATTCAAAFADNDQLDNQSQSPVGTADNAVTLAGCSYNASPFGGPSTEDRPVAFELTSGPGALLCPGLSQQSQVCALSGINYQPGAEYRVLVNNEVGKDATGTARVQFCADDPPVEGRCGPEDEQTSSFTIVWQRGGAGGGSALTLDLQAKKQKLKKKIQFFATATVTSTLVARGKKIKTTSKQLVANQKTTVKAKLKRKAKKQLAKKLEKKGKATVKVRGTATTQSGTEATDTVKVKLKP